MTTEGQLMKLKKEELVAKCKELALSTGGTKSELTKRILEKQAAADSAEAPKADEAPAAASSAPAEVEASVTKETTEVTTTETTTVETPEATVVKEATVTVTTETKTIVEPVASPTHAPAPAPVEAPKPEEPKPEAAKPEEPKPAAAKPEEPKPAAPSMTEAEAEMAAAEEEELEEIDDKPELNLSKRELQARKRKLEKRKKLKEKKKAQKAEEKPATAAGKGAAKGGGKGKQVRPTLTPKISDEIEVDYVAPDVMEGVEVEDDEAFKAVVERFKHVEPEEKPEEDEDEEDKPRRRTRPKTSLLEEAADSDDEEKKGDLSKKKRKLEARVSVAELKTSVKRPDVVEVWDTTAADPRLLVYLKAYRNTVTVPRHWSSKRKYMAGKRGVEKPPFKLPEFIEATGIAKIRQAILEKQADRSLKGKSRDKAHPKMGKLDIDYQVLHDAFFKFAKPPKLSKHNDLYYEGKEYEAKLASKRPGQLSAALKEALGMEEGAPPPWLFNMQRYGPPPAYPNLKIPGLNAPIPQGADYGFHPGGWGKPPVDEFGQPLYGDFRHQEEAAEPEDATLWGEVDEDYEEDEDDDDMMQGGEGTATPMLGTATPLMGSGSATPVVSMEGGLRSISGVSSITSGMDTPHAGSRSKRGGIASVSGVSSASLTPTPQLFQVLEEQKSRSKGLVPTGHTYKVGSRTTGSSSAMGGIGSSGTGTPIGGLAGVGTPIAGIGTPHGISTPHGIGTPGMGTHSAYGTRTPHGISTPIGITGVGTPGVGTPHGIGTPAGGIGTPLGIGGIATPVGGLAMPVGGVATPVGGIATPVGGIATPVGGIATPVGGIATPTGLPGGVGTPAAPVTLSLNPGEVEAEGIMTADIIRQQLKEHEQTANKAKLAAGQKDVEPRKGAKEKKRKDKTKFKF
mmetsp:Transcript_40287/g.86489  ORF Transcript_40287/g.86489 Transcript_40287/m.86489 type:complete len:907 (-) Transcript_40287:84-2804(-)|eukprot:CAMPEP_0206457238 /NCGR_PEP_ID=MMETSP0324_2-20121206/22843_1 /ASSEMBLY_ACC=CAM_ASM_000836 /TAXON_ID=2866 /ORGANISM="Crypthecodinium cohnii, Strain Seligo" /LENGTH=906 /DNA_ID=CAMNT_0053928323 /DNA_START=169 /DNA_END=2889 /DNA_ORIENTATION=-